MNWQGSYTNETFLNLLKVFFKTSINQSIVGTELFPFNSRSVHVHERNFGHFFKGNSVMNVNGTSVTFSQWTECKSLFIFSVRAEHIFAKKHSKHSYQNIYFIFFSKKVLDLIAAGLSNKLIFVGLQNGIIHRIRNY